ncbi:MAG TPA: GrpB family protein, partial [Anaerolineales bacterium]|nr:GrpB family protein [Anaerolineales bacterium]
QRAGIASDHVPPGYSGPESDWEKWYFHPPASQRPTHLHVRRAGAPNQRYPLLVRDYLRAHPATAAAYAELKRRLAAGLADPHTYPDVKDPASDLIYLAAEEWSTRTGWKPWMPDA